MQAPADCSSRNGQQPSRRSVRRVQCPARAGPACADQLTDAFRALTPERRHARPEIAKRVAGRQRSALWGRSVDVVPLMNAEHSSQWGSHRQIRLMALMAATAIGIYLCYLMALPFLPALTWALALAVLFMPIHRRLESTLKHPNLAASATILLIGSIVVVPAAFIGQRLISEAVTSVDTVRANPALGGYWGKALILTVWGGVIVAGIDNVIYPILVGNRLTYIPRSWPSSEASLFWLVRPDSGSCAPDGHHAAV